LIFIDAFLLASKVGNSRRI